MYFTCVVELTNRNIYVYMFENIEMREKSPIFWNDNSVMKVAEIKPFDHYHFIESTTWHKNC